MSYKSFYSAFCLTGALFMLTACNTSNTTNSSETNNALVRIPTPQFNADSAYLYTQKQVDFGPRIPNSAAHAQCASYLSSELTRLGATVIVQEAELRAFDNTLIKAKNIIGQFNPEKNNRLLLFAHWDTRPFADNDPDHSNYNKPIDGANDGASGVGVLLEIARNIGLAGHNMGIDIIFFDAEDYGQASHLNMPYMEDSWCLGSQYWAQNPHKKDYSARYGILLDMAGAKNALFYKEMNSMQFAPQLNKRIWDTANRLGYGNQFIYENGGHITDDHVYVNKYRRIPCVDIIQHDPTTNSSFGSYWHTLDDTMENVDRGTMKAVGQTVMEVIYSEE